MIVVDASAMVTALADDTSRGAACRNRLTDDPHWTAPAHMPVEVLRALARHVRAGDVTAEAADAYAAALGRAFVQYTDPTPDSLARIWALRHNVSAYDAAYVALAETFDAPLLTYDERLAKAAARMCTVVIP